MATHKKFSSEILLFPGLVDYTNTVLDVQNGPNFHAGFNLVCALFVCTAYCSCLFHSVFPVFYLLYACLPL